MPAGLRKISETASGRGGWKLPGGARALGVLVAGFLVLGGCIPIPVNYHSPGYRHNVTLASTNLLQVGRTTREQVLLTLGEPDFVTKDGRRFSYVSVRVRGLVLMLNGELFKSSEHYLLEATFDASNRVDGLFLVVTPSFETLQGGF